MEIVLNFYTFVHFYSPTFLILFTHFICERVSSLFHFTKMTQKIFSTKEKGIQCIATPIQPKTKNKLEVKKARCISRITRDGGRKGENNLSWLLCIIFPLATDPICPFPFRLQASIKVRRLFPLLLPLPPPPSTHFISVSK